MPTYDYVCERCKHEFEEFQSITAKPLRDCPKCGKRSLKRLIGAGAGVIFKGSGFYQTDYRSEGYRKAADADKPKTESSDSKPDKPKSDAKPAATESKPVEATSKKDGATSSAPVSTPAKSSKTRSTRGKSK